MSKYKYIWTIVIPIVFSYATPAFPAVTVGDRVPLMTLEDIDGASMRSLSEFNTKVVMITVWASWCGVCRQQMPQLMKLQNELGSSGFSIVAINVDEPRANGLKYIRDLEKSQKLGFAVLHDAGTEARTKLGYSGVPNNFIVGNDGTIVDIIRGGIGASTYEDVKRELAAFIEGKGKPGRNAQEGARRDEKREGTKLKIDSSRIIISEGLAEKEDVARVLQSGVPRIWSCYRKEVEKRPMLQGEILARLVIGADGKVEKAVVEQSYLESEPLENCLAGTLGGLVFVKPKVSPVVIRYPFVFKKD
jgi:thiol-disulfide isomerase/thioredoxin